MKRNVFVISILIIALLFSVGRCRFNSKKADINLNALTDTVTHFTNNLGTQSASIAAIQLEEIQLKKTMLAKDKYLAMLAKQFSEIKAIVKYTQIVKLDTINVVFKDTVPCNFNRTGTLNTSWYSLNYKSNNKGFTIDSLTIPNQTTVITGFKRTWFLGKETLITDITNTNPHINVSTIQSVQTTITVPWQKKWYLWLGAGLAGGYLISR